MVAALRSLLFFARFPSLFRLRDARASTAAVMRRTLGAITGQRLRVYACRSNVRNDEHLTAKRFHGNEKRKRYDETNDSRVTAATSEPE